MLNELFVGFVKSLWWIIPIFGVLGVGAVYECVKGR